MPKRILIFLIALSACLLPASASAHFLKTDNSIGVVLHIDPDDDPAAGQTTTIFFDTKDKKGKYQPSDCTCQMVVLKDGSEIDSVSAVAVDGETSSVSYAFPAIGVYQVVFQGSPVSAGGFQDFKVSWDVRVDHAAGESRAPSAFLQQFEGHGIHLVLIVIATVFMLGYIAFENKREKKRKALAKK